MAQRRMFSSKVVDTDRFLDMPASTQLLYFHLGMRADDDGFISSPRKITASVGSSADDMKLLITKGYIIAFDSGVCVITDWKQNNYLQKDRYTPTIYQEEKSQLAVDANGSYTLCIQPVYTLDTQDRLGKDRLDKDREAKASCAESSDKPEAPPKKPIITLTLNDKTDYPVYEEQAYEWAELYPAVDVWQQLREMKGWCNANPKKRKTKSGILRFINNWLAREQNKAPPRTRAPAQTGSVFRSVAQERGGVT